MMTMTVSPLSVCLLLCPKNFVSFLCVSEILWRRTRALNKEKRYGERDFVVLSLLPSNLLRTNILYLHHHHHHHHHHLSSISSFRPASLCNIIMSPSSSNSAPKRTKKQEQEQQQEERLLKLAQDRVSDAMTLFQEQRGDSGLLYWNEALDIVQDIRGVYHPETARMYLGLAATLQVRHQKYGQAKQLFQQALRIYQTSLGESNSYSSGDDYLTASGAGRYSKGSLQALMGLGTAYTELEKWHEAMKIFQSAVRLELYDLLISSENDDSTTIDDDSFRTTIRNELISVDYLKRLVRNIQKINSPKKNNKKVWSHFPLLPQKMDAYLDAVQATVQHEVRGDRLYRHQDFEAATQEYQTARTILQSQVHTTQHWGIPLDKVWLVRKQSLAELSAARRYPSSSSTISTTTNQDDSILFLPFDLNQLSLRMVEEDEEGHDDQHGAGAGDHVSWHCPTFSRVCEALVKADTLLLLETPDHKALQEAVHLYEEARTLVHIYRSVYDTIRDFNDDDDDDDDDASTIPRRDITLKDLLYDLGQHLVPEGQAQPKLKGTVTEVWEQLQRLTILVEEAPTTTATQTGIPATSTCPIRMDSPFCFYTDNHGSNNSFFMLMLFLLLIVLQFVLLPLVLFRKAGKMTTTTTRNKCEATSEAAAAEAEAFLQEKSAKTKEAVVKKASSPRLEMPPPPSSSFSGEEIETFRRPLCSGLMLGVSVPPTATSLSFAVPLTTLAFDVATKTDRAIHFLQVLDRMEENLMEQSETATPGSDTNNILANKVSAIVWMQKTRQAILTSLIMTTEEDEDEREEQEDEMEEEPTIPDEGGDENKKQFTQHAVASFLQRMEELGYASLFLSQLLSIEDEESSLPSTGVTSKESGGSLL